MPRQSDGPAAGGDLTWLKSSDDAGLPGDRQDGPATPLVAAGAHVPAALPELTGRRRHAHGVMLLWGMVRETEADSPGVTVAKFDKPAVTVMIMF